MTDVGPAPSAANDVIVGKSAQAGTARALRKCSRKVEWTAQTSQMGDNTMIAKPYMNWLTHRMHVRDNIILLRFTVT